MRSRANRPSRHCAVEFHALPSRIGQVRKIVSAQLRYWRLDPLVDLAALGVTELLANVHRHAGPDKHCTVELALLYDRLKISVRDHDPRLPQLRTARTTDTCGRGLALVAAISDTWGMRVERDGSGKVIWFTLPAPFVTPAVPSSPASLGTSTHFASYGPETQSQLRV
ncbi:ATP-binding protein [Streptomyces sp. NPDC005438]|uniref:ATP-binding protein n=1 Tax=Streptomyces sp. NPDC005438 TaxID=3156880 RepID=UPI0033AE6CA6